MKKIFILGTTILLVFLIYLSTIDKKVYFLTLTSDKNNAYNDKVKTYLERKGLLEKYITGFSKEDMRITDFIRLVENNETIVENGKEQSIKNALIKADMVVVETGKVDLFSKLAYETNENILYEYVDALVRDMDTYLSLLRVYCKEDIYLLKIYNPGGKFNQNVIDYMNDKLKMLASRYKICYVDYDITDDMIYDTVELTEKGQDAIYKSLMKNLSKTLFGSKTVI